MSMQKIISLTGLMLLLLINVCSYGQSKAEKTTSVIKDLGLLESYKLSIEYKLKPLMYMATGQDSIRLLEIEKQYSEEEILNRLIQAFDEAFSEKEINDLYTFAQSSAFEKLMSSEENVFSQISARFMDVENELDSLSRSVKTKIDESHYSAEAAMPADKFKPITVERENGFYATIDYSSSAALKDIKLKKNPGLTFQDVKEVSKDVSLNNKRPEISLLLTREGARKFYLLTKENIGKPVALVIDKHIVYLPRVQTAINGGKVVIGADFSDDEIDRMIDIIQKEIRE